MLAALLATPLGSARLRAQDADPEARVSALDTALVFGAARHAQSLGDAALAVTVVGRAEIRAFGYRTLAEVLESVPGFSARTDRNYAAVGIRGVSPAGASGGRILLLVDGRRMNVAVMDLASLGTEAPIDLDLVERVEVVRGPGASLYGNNATLAVVNVITRRALAEGASAALSAGSFGTVRGIAAFGAEREDRGAYLAVSGYRQAGQDYVFPELAGETDAAGTVRGLDTDRAVRLFARGRWKELSASAGLIERRKTVPTAAYETSPGDPRFVTRDMAAFGWLQLEHDFADLSRLWVTTDWGVTRYEAGYPYGEVVNRDEIGGHSVGLEAQYLRLVGAGHEVLAGAELRRGLGQYQRNFDLEPAVVNLDDRRSAWLASGFLQAEVRVAAPVRLSTGLRYDWYELFGGAFSPRAALIVRPDAATSFRVGYGRTLRLPSAMEGFYDDGGYSWKAAGSALRPEHVATLEASVQHAVADGWRLGATAYELRATRLITQGPDSADGLLMFRNEGEVRARGVELELVGRLAGASLQGTYAYQRARPAAGVVLAGSPRHLARVGVIAPLAGERLTASGSVRVIGARPTFAGTHLPAVGLLGAGVTASPLQGGDLALELHVHNLLDQRHVETGTLDLRQAEIPQDGRSVTAGVRYHWR